MYNRIIRQRCILHFKATEWIFFFFLLVERKPVGPNAFNFIRSEYHLITITTRYYCTAAVIRSSKPELDTARLLCNVFFFFFLNEKHSYVFDSDLVSHQNIVLRVGAPSVKNMKSLNFDKIKSLSLLLTAKQPIRKVLVPNTINFNIIHYIIKSMVILKR